MKGVAWLLVAVLVTTGCLSNSGGLLGREPTPNFAEALLWSQPSELVVEIHYEQGREPSKYAIDRVREDLTQLTNKQTITILDPVEINVGDGTQSQTWTTDEIAAVHAATYSLGTPETYMAGDQAFIHFVILNGKGQLSDDRGFIGLQTVPALYVFPDQTRTALLTIYAPEPIGPPAIAPDQAEASIFIHELGHALGLVGREAPETQDRKTTTDSDPCACHSRNEDSVMYPGVERFNLVRFIEEGRWHRDSFDAVDLADIAALRDMDPHR